MSFDPTRNEPGVAAFTLGYIVLFTIWFLSVGNYEFIIYVVTMLALVVLVGASLGRAGYPPAMLWALSLWGLAHMAGGGVPVGGAVLYNLKLLPLISTDRLFILKYDQLVHAYGFAVAACVLHHLLVRHFPTARGTATALVYPALASMGLGAVNEIIEFSAVLAVPDTNVGGYINTALDLCFNALGACIAVAVIGFRRDR
ncbi:DUF2238 domain-containing protein [Roseobacter ponti]|uniref:DUF2238 domain-containing protein n=1 Tax=Roseobacter ponti TaxID=1891787 RepID=A0A858SQR5_9RHOB|nr:DUF2238 domain-containing protein [Roseobacter ponti]QJF51199.1 DUF2238 domain-containing protein [Roseobacter ponti]